jgi:hypothetical protein
VLNIQWFEMFSITSGEMRLSVSFLDGADGVIVQTHFVTTGQSAGWQGTVTGSEFTKRNQAVVVPPGAVKVRCSLVSGGPAETLGVMIVDDLSVALPPQAALLAGNFWLNSTFETGSNLEQTNGTPANWSRGGNDSVICQILTDNFTSASHALALVDTNESGYGEWYSDLTLGANASPGDLVDIKWFELHSITNGEMRLTATFFDASPAIVGETHFVATGQSDGWLGTIAGSPFTLRRGQVPVPPGAVRMRFSLVSGGPELTTGVMVIDDLSAAVHVVPPSVLAGNFFPNPTFEDGVQLDEATLGSPSGGWQRGGSASSIDQISTNNSVSSTHSLALVDDDSGNYGEWYLFLNLAGIVSDGDALDLQWYQIYSVTNENMRLSFAFLDAGNVELAKQDYSVSDQSPGWNGSVGSSPFQRQYQRLAVPPGTTQLRVNFASGGSSLVTGTMVIDDLSVRLTKPVVTEVTSDSSGVNLTWNSAPNKNYTVLYSSDLGPAAVWTPLVTGLSFGELVTTYLDNAGHSSNHGFYQVVQE